MTSLSVGVKSTGILVNSLSKLHVSRRFLCKLGWRGEWGCWCLVGGVDVGGGLRDIAVEGGKWNGMGGGEEKKKEKTFLVTSLNGRAHLLKEAHSSSFGRRIKVRDLITDYLQFPYRSF